MLKLSLCDYSDEDVILNGIITAWTNFKRSSNNTNKEAMFKNCAPFRDCITEINNIQVDNVKDLDVVMPMPKWPAFPPWFPAFPPWFPRSHHSPNSVPRFPIPAFADSPYDLIEYSDNHANTSRSLWQYCKDEPDNNIAGSKSSKFKWRFRNKTNADGTVEVKIAVKILG